MKKLLVANRSEIAIRVFRAATELGLRTVAVYSYEDRFSLHRFKSDESFPIGPQGGGGRGMRVVRNSDELLGKLEEAQREAGAAFGKADVFIERYISRAKHIEVQMLGDAHGNLVHLWERDCSVQRRHQKVVEVAPGINLPIELRKKICDEIGRASCRERG